MICRNEIMQLNAGREIDLLVAEQVMGWVLETDEAKLRQLSRYVAREEGRRWWRSPEGGWHCDPPSFSSDMRDGWKVVERMKTSGKLLSLVQDVYGNKITFGGPNAAGPDYIVEKSVLLGICKAALLATI